MKKPKKDPVREDRIHNDAIADANGPEEQVMGWYYYLDDKIRFPFRAKCIAAKVVSPLRKGETVEVQRMAPEDACSADMLVLIRWHGRTMAVPLSQLVAIDPDRPPPRPLAIGITGWRRATASEPRRPARYYAALPKAHQAFTVFIPIDRRLN
jgi:Calcium binding